MQPLLALQLAAGLAGLAAAAAVAQSDPRNPKTPIKATMTYYGSTDGQSGNCQTKTVACGYYTTGQYDYYAAISQYYYGCGTGGGACQGCGKCWLISAQNDSSGNALRDRRSIVVKINNLCPNEGNPLCAQSGPNDVNQYGAKVNLDTCSDSGASAALFGKSGVGLAVGYAEQVDCSMWGKPYTGHALTGSSSGGSSSGGSSSGGSSSGGSSGGSSSGGGSSSCSALYGQCGGQSWTGAKCCAAGSTCQVQNAYYSQCLPPK